MFKIILPYSRDQLNFSKFLIGLTLLDFCKFLIYLHFCRSHICISSRGHIFLHPIFLIFLVLKNVRGSNVDISKLKIWELECNIFFLKVSKTLYCDLVLYVVGRCDACFFFVGVASICWSICYYFWTWTIHEDFRWIHCKDILLF
jgi:hypothetical protein